MTQVVHKKAEVDDGVSLHYVEAGEPGADLVVLLHGFPELWYSWRRQIPALARAGFRVVAPDLRGYNLSDKPAAIGAYGISTLARDVARLVEACGAERAFVAGHDWGGGVAWAFAMLHPERLRRLAILNAPHPERMLAGLRNPEQLAKSWYMFLFQLPWLPEELLKLDDFKILVQGFHGAASPDAFSAEDIAIYKEAWQRPGALRAMLAYYRAMLRPSTQVKMKPIEAEVLVLWGEDDPHLGVALATPKAKWVPHVRVELVPKATHWLQHDAPARVNEELIAFFRAQS